MLRLTIAELELLALLVHNYVALHSPKVQSPQLQDLLQCFERGNGLSGTAV